MKIYFINPPFKGEYGKFSRESRSPSIGHSGVLYYPLWLIYAAAYCEKKGFEIEFLDAPAKRLSSDESLSVIESKGAGTKLFVIDTSTPSIFSDVAFCDALKSHFPQTFICLVGTHPTATVEETMAISPSVDGIARKEYDQIVFDLATALEKGNPLASVKGLSYRSQNAIVNNPDADYITDLDEIPFASKFIKERLDVRDYVFPAASYPAIQIFTGRGCPAHCNFCVYPQVMHGHIYRKRSPQNIIEELSYVSQVFPAVKEIVFEDDTFTIDKPRIIEFSKLMVSTKLNKRFKWLCNARVGLDYETMVAMKKAGCRLIIPGIESFDQDILNNIKKGTTISGIERYVKDAHKAHLLIHACYMVGNKGETKETMEKTLAAAMRFKTDTAQFFPLIPYPGTEAYQWAKTNGYITKGYKDYCAEDGTLNCVLEEPGLSSKELVDFCAYARKKYYWRPWYIGHRLWEGLKHPSDLKRSLKGFKVIKKSLFKANSKKDPTLEK